MEGVIIVCGPRRSGCSTMAGAIAAALGGVVTTDADAVERLLGESAVVVLDASGGGVPPLPVPVRATVNMALLRAEGEGPPAPPTA